MTFIKGTHLQVWMYGNGYAAESTLDEACQLAVQYKLTGICEKALDGTTWMGHIPNGPRLIGASAVAEHRALAESYGLTYSVWTNPLWGDRAHLAQQAQIYAAAGRAAGILVLDVEPYDLFWGANRPHGDATFFLDTLRHAAMDLPIVFQPDPRPARLAELRAEEWFPYANVYAGQHYWNAFGTTPTSEMGAAVDVCNQYEFEGEIAPTLPGDAAPYEVSSALISAELDGHQGVFVWRMGIAGPDVLDVLATSSFAKPEEIIIEPPDELTVLRDKIARIQSILSE